MHDSWPFGKHSGGRQHDLDPHPLRNAEAGARRARRSLLSRRADSTVFSSEAGRICPHCALPTGRCVCRANPRGARTESTPEGDGIVRVGRSSKGRKGKTVTSVTGLPLPQDELRELAKDLKRICGTGGTLKEGVVEIQGDHRDTLVRELEQRGFRVKRSGG
jgi:translation initiation factor 1